MTNQLTVYVYNGIGNSNCYLPFVSKLFDLVNVKYVDNLSFLSKKQHSPSDIIYFGGGRGQHVMDNLPLYQINDLKHNVSNNQIRYIGVCCGAYLAGKSIVFDGTNKKTLGLCNTVSFGPYYKKGFSGYNYSVDNSTVLSNYLICDDRNVNVYLNGGGWFSNIPKDYTIVSYYENSSLPSIIMNKQILLSHVHIEHPATNKIFYTLVSSFIFDR